MHRFPLVILLVLIGQSLSAQTEADSTALFRYAYFGDRWTVTLDEPVGIPPHLLESGVVTVMEPGMYRLGFYQTFDYAVVPVVVTISTDAQDRVVYLHFDYGEEYDWDHERSGYEESLGPPASNGEDVVIWKDPVTRFTLVRGSGGSRSYSVLRSLRSR